MRIVVTGANGFIGRSLVPRLREAGHSVLAAGRAIGPAGVDLRLDLAARPVVEPAALHGCEAIIHLAGLAHAGREQAARAETVNAAGTLDLAQKARRAGVPHFLFVSTAQVHGRVSRDRPLREEDPFDPRDPYAESKARAETQLKALAQGGGMGVTVVRPPLVVGFGGSGNVARLARAARRGWPVPTGLRHNTRSVIARRNLADLLAALAVAPAPAPGHTAYLVREARDLSTRDLYLMIAEALGVSPLSVPAPRWLLRASLSATGHGRMASALLDDFRIDDGKLRVASDWRPRLDLGACLRAEVLSGQADG